MNDIIEGELRCLDLSRRIYNVIFGRRLTGDEARKCWFMYLSCFFHPGCFVDGGVGGSGYYDGRKC